MDNNKEAVRAMMESQIAEKELKERTGCRASFGFVVIVTLATVVAGAMGIGMWWVIVPGLCTWAIFTIRAVHNKETKRSDAKRVLAGYERRESPRETRRREKALREQEATMDYERLADEATRQCVGLGEQAFTPLCKRFGITYSGGNFEHGFDACALRFSVELKMRGRRDVRNIVGGIKMMIPPH